MTDKEQHGCQAVDFIGRCVGFSQIGKRCVFVDLLVDAEAGPGSVQLAAIGSSGPDVDDGGAPAGQPPQTTVVIHLAGDHLPRASGALRTPLPPPGAVVHSTFIGQDARALTPAQFAAFTTTLGTPGELAKPRIGDVFAVVGEQTMTQLVGDVTVRRVNARGVALLTRGDAPKPGDYSEKWRVGVVKRAEAAAAAGEGEIAHASSSSESDDDDADHEPPSASPVNNGALPEYKLKPMKVGVPRRNKNRFEVLRRFCVDKFFAAASSSTGAATARILDIAGGSGKLSGVFLGANGVDSDAVVVDSRARSGPPSNRGWTLLPTIVDPRPSSMVKAGASAPIVEALFNVEAQSAIIEQSHLLLGLHCDGAVNEIVRAATKFQKSFVICPCCVFPKAYPRHLDSGEVVMTRDALVQWILEEARRGGYTGELFSVRLDFQGANLCAVGHVPF
jgi:hypothetical protein